MSSTQPRTNNKSKQSTPNAMPLTTESNPMPMPQQKSMPQPKVSANPIAQQAMPVPQQNKGAAQTAPIAVVPTQNEAANTRFISNLQAIMGPPQLGQQRSSSKNNQRGASQGATAARNAATALQQQKERMPSLHFGNLPDQFYDLDLFKYIKNAGHKVHKAFVVQDKKTQKNAKYGYAQFLTADEAKKCLDSLNNAIIDGSVITVSMQVQAKPNPKANIFVRNLPTKVTQQEIFELYSKYGSIVKSKLEYYADNTSRGFAYVQFEKETDASAAIAATNGMEMQGKKLEVFAHEKKKSTPVGGAAAEVTPTPAGEATTTNSPLIKSGNNIFVQGLPRGTNEEQLKTLFSTCGSISSALVQSADSEDPMSNNGFVCFNESADAVKAIQNMHKKKIEEKDGKATFLLVQPHVAKRENDMTMDKTRAPIQQNMKKCFDSNLFIRNIPNDTEQQAIEDVFKAHGTIISIKMKNKKNQTNAPSTIGRFKMAFILYENVEMAQAAIRCLDQTRPFGLTPIEVEFWVSRVDLQQEREEKQKQEMKRLIQSGLNDLQAQFMGQPAGHSGQHSHQGGFRNRGGRGNQTGRGGRPQTGGNMRNPNHQGGNGQNRQRSGNNRNNQRQQFVPQGNAAQAQTVTQQNTPSNSNNFLVGLPQVDQAQLAAIADINERKQVIGNAIYSAVQPFVGEFAGKITGMLLDENVVDMTRLTSDQKYLSDLVNEAWRLLRSQQQIAVQATEQAVTPE